MSETATKERLTMAEWREERGMSQLEVALATGVTHTQICRVEKGETSLKAPSARKLMKFYGVGPRKVEPVIWTGPERPKNRPDVLSDKLRAELRGAKRALHKAYDFMADDSNITFKAQDIRDDLLPEIQRELRGT